MVEDLCDDDEGGFLELKSGEVGRGGGVSWGGGRGVGLAVLERDGVYRLFADCDEVFVDGVGDGGRVGVCFVVAGNGGWGLGWGAFSGKEALEDLLREFGIVFAVVELRLDVLLELLSEEAVDEVALLVVKSDVVCGGVVDGFFVQRVLFLYLFEGCIGNVLLELSLFWDCFIGVEYFLNRVDDCGDICVEVFGVVLCVEGCADVFTYLIFFLVIGRACDAGRAVGFVSWGVVVDDKVCGEVIGEGRGYGAGGYLVIYAGCEDGVDEGGGVRERVVAGGGSYGGEKVVFDEGGEEFVAGVELVEVDVDVADDGGTCCGEAVGEHVEGGAEIFVEVAVVVWRAVEAEEVVERVVALLCIVELEEDGAGVGDEDVVKAGDE